MIINDNLMGLTALNYLNANQQAQSSDLAHLSSGLRINSAADDAAGLAISTKMDAQTNGLNQAVRNSQDGISLLQTASGALNETTSILQRLRQLAIQSANDTNNSSDRSQIQKEVKQLQSEVSRIANTTQFNTKNLLDGSLSATKTALHFQIGANQNQTLAVNIANMQATKNGLNITAVSLGTQTGAEKAISLISKAISMVSSQQSNFGALQNRLQHTINNLTTASQNLTAANANIKDVDMAAQMMDFTKQQILVQSGTAMLAQANQAPQAVLKLLG